MLETIAIILIILWVLGIVSGYTLGNFIWVLLFVAVILFLVRLVYGDVPKLPWRWSTLAINLGILLITGPWIYVGLRYAISDYIAYVKWVIQR